MASPQLKKTAVVAPARRLINSGVVPTTQVRLKGIGGQIIQPKAPVSPFKKKAAAPAAATEEPAAPEPIAVPEPIAAPEPVAAPEPITAAAPEPQAAPEPAAEPAPEPETTPEPAPEPTPEPETTPEPAAEPAPETETPTEAAGEEPTAEQLAQDEAYQREMEEYQRQMEEYNRQMEEYNRQMAELAAQEAAAAEPPAEAPAEATAEAPVEATAEAPAEAPVEAPAEAPAAEQAPAPEPAAAPAPAAAATPKLSVKKPGLGLKKPGLKAKSPLAGGAPAAAAAPAPAEAAADLAAAGEPTPAEAEASIYDMMANIAPSSPPLWKNKLVIIAAALLLVAAGLSAYLYIKKMQEDAIATANNAKVMSVLRRAQEINKEQVETLADAKAKGVNVKFTPEEVSFLLDIVVNPGMKDELGRPMFGNKPEGSAQLAVLGIGLACEENGEHCKLTFERMEKEAPLIKPNLYRWLLMRLAATNIKGLNSKFRKLADALSANEDPKFRSRQELLSYIWEAMTLRVTEKDVPAILKLLNQPDMDGKLAYALINCLSNIVNRMDDATKKATLGDTIFDTLAEDSMRVNAADALAAACSPKALEFFKKRAKDTNNLRTDASFFGNYGSDDILPFLLDLRDTVADDKRATATVQAMITSLFGQRRDRSDEQVKSFLAAIPAYDKVDMDTSDWDEVNEKTDPDSSTFIGDTNPQYPALKQRREELETCRKQKLALIHQLSGMLDYRWVISRLEQYAESDTDIQLAREARAALDQVKKNREAEDSKQDKFKSRDKG